MQTNLTVIHVMLSCGQVALNNNVSNSVALVLWMDKK